jgi:hypothetical protein
MRCWVSRPRQSGGEPRGCCPEANLGQRPGIPSVADIAPPLVRIRLAPRRKQICPRNSNPRGVGRHPGLFSFRLPCDLPAPGQHRIKLSSPRGL